MTQAVASSSVRGSQVAADQPKVFDIGTEAGLLFLLRAIHRSAIKQVVKNQLRDTLFDFQKGDSKQFEFIKKVLGDAGFSVVMTGVTADIATPKEQGEVKKNAIGRARVTPTFVKPVVQAVSPVKAPAAVSTAEPAVVAVAPKVSEIPVVDTVVPPAPIAPPPNTAVSSATEVVSSTVATAPTSPTPTPTDSPLAVSPVLPSVSPEGASAMERIKEIKHAINEKVGNPVTLIDIDNQVGREYMNALLSAMKAINGGRPDDVANTMARLEKAYVAAMALAKDRPAEVVTQEPIPPPRPAPIVATPATVPPPPVMPEPVPAAVAPNAVTPLRPVGMGMAPSAAVVPGATSSLQQSDGLVSTPVKINVSTASADVAARASQGFASPVAPTGIPLTMPTAEPAVSVPITSKLADVQAALKSDVVAPPLEESVVPTMTSGVGAPTSMPTHVGAPAMAAHNSEPSRLMSVAKEEQLQNLMRQNQIQEAQKNKTFESQDRASMEPIMLPEVTAGLKQLLSEWSLFKGSGFFGTGPSGADHPLYKQIAGLTMAAVIAGRFEGATPSVKQSITDYMNGWRYEEGIVHEHTETFEHYLRRVIKHILDQKGIVRQTD